MMEHVDPNASPASPALRQLADADESSAPCAEGPGMQSAAWPWPRPGPPQTAAHEPPVTSTTLSVTLDGRRYASPRESPCQRTAPPGPNSDSDAPPAVCVVVAHSFSPTKIFVQT